MDLEKLQEDLNSSYNHRYRSVDKRVNYILDYLSNDLHVEVEKLNLQEIKSITNTILEIETKTLDSDVEKLLAQKEQIDRALEKKADELQNSKYEVFNALETKLGGDSDALLKLHQVKLQSIDLYCFLSEMVESAIITALEKTHDGDISEITQEVIKDITFETISEGSLNTIRMRKILSTILQSAIEVAEATPVKANEILEATIKGMRIGLVRSIAKFKQQLAYMPIEAKHILIEDYDTIMGDLNNSDVFFTQLIQTQASECDPDIAKILLDINSKIGYDLQDLINISKETAEVMKERLSTFAKTAVKTADTAMKSQKAQEAKRMGMQAWGVARTAMEATLQSAKDAMDNKSSNK